MSVGALGTLFQQSCGFKAGKKLATVATVVEADIVHTTVTKVYTTVRQFYTTMRQIYRP
jgi:hypothetical protein